MGQLIRERGLRPDLVLCSTAQRAVAHLALAVAELGDAPPLYYDDQLYLASPDRILDVVVERGAGDAASWSSAMILGCIIWR